MTGDAYLEKPDHDDPSSYAQATAFNIVTRHKNCLRDGEPFQALVDDVAEAIERARKFGMEEVSRAWFTEK